MSMWSRGAAISGCSPQVRTSSASASLVPSGASSAMRLGMPSRRSCSSASSAFCSSSAAATTAFSSRARSTSAGRSSALAPFTDWATRLVSARASSPRWIAALRPESSFSSADDVQGVAPAGQLADGVGGGIEQDAGVVHPTRVSARWRTGFEQAAVARSADRSSVTFRPAQSRQCHPAAIPAAHARPTRPGVAGRAEIVGGCAAAHSREASPCPLPNPLQPPPSRPTRPARPTSRCSATRSATTSTARSPRQPDREALVDVPSGRRWTYAQLRADVDALALGLLAAGVEKGDRVGIWAPNCAEWTLVQYATAKIGAILVNINPAYRTHELEYVLNQSGIAAAGRGHELQDVRLRGDDRRGAAELPRAARGRAARHARVGRARRRRASAATAPSSPRCRPSCSPDDPINIQYTSGTTGFPKGATLSHHNILNNGYFVGELLRLQPTTTGSASRCPSTTASAW